MSEQRTGKRLLLPDLDQIAELESDDVDLGQNWVRWTPEREQEDSELRAAVHNFEPVSHPAGHAAAEWLRNRSLRDYRSTVTKLCMVDGALEGFYSLRCSDVRLRTDHRKEFGEHPIQPAALVTWLAKRRDAQIEGWRLLLHAIGIAVRVSQDIGLVTIVLDPHDQETADKVWRRDPYNFRTSQTVNPNSPPRLWRSLLL